MSKDGFVWVQSWEEENQRGHENILLSRTSSHVGGLVFSKNTGPNLMSIWNRTGAQGKGGLKILLVVPEKGSLHARQYLGFGVQQTAPWSRYIPLTLRTHDPPVTSILPLNPGHVPLVPQASLHPYQTALFSTFFSLLGLWVDELLLCKHFVN